MSNIQFPTPFAFGVAACSSAALPAYTYANGASGVGATITATANGVCPLIDSTVTLVANDTINGTILLHHGAAASDNGIWQLTQQGSGGTPFIFTRLVGIDTAAGMASSTVRVRGGLTRGGGIYTYVNPGAITVGTTPLFWIRQNRNGSDECYDIDEDFCWSSGGGGITVSQAAPTGEWFTAFTSGTATCTAVHANNTAAIVGQVQLSVTTLAATSQIYSRGGAITIDTLADIDITWTLSNIPTISDGTTNFSLVLGLKANGTTHLAVAEYDKANSNNWCATTNDGTTTQRVTTGPAVANNTQYKCKLRKYCGETTWHVYINGTEIGTGNNTNVPTGAKLEIMALATKTLNAAGALTALLDRCQLRFTYPLGR